jgi:phosphinothricin acetyltransferase
MSEFALRACNLEEHGKEILVILNDAIVNSTALYDYVPRTIENMVSWFAAKDAGEFPVVGAFDDRGQLVGFGSFGTFRAYPAYKYTVEHSVYVREDQRGRGLGRVLVSQLIEEAKARDLHTMIGVIDSSNVASINLHESLGFSRVGLIPQVGFKFGRWLDVVLMQIVLATPAEPVDG